MNQEREYIDRLWACTNIIDGLYYKSARSLHIKNNMLALFYALGDGNVHSQKQLCEEYLFPKTTLNTIVRECAQKNYIALVRENSSKEKSITLTDKGREYARSILEPIYAAETAAINRTLQQVSPEFVDALECFTKHLQAAFAQRILHLE